MELFDGYLLKNVLVRLNPVRECI